MGISPAILGSAVARASLCKRLWLGAGGVALFIATIFCGRAVLLPSSDHRGMAVDFIAFYTAGSFVREGRMGELYDLEAVKRFQRQLAARQGEELKSVYAPWWNPPFYALLFAPLSRMPYPTALKVWVGINLLSAAAACWLLCRMLPRGAALQAWSLVPVLLTLSTPFIYAISHAQNSCVSLLILAGMVCLWRAQKPLAAGMVIGLLFYKPQLAIVPIIVLVFDQGWRAGMGVAISGLALLLMNVVALPGTLADYLHRLPANVHLLQTHWAYPWERHVTFKAFWRLICQGNRPGEISAVTYALVSTSSLVVAWWLFMAWRKSRATFYLPEADEGKLIRDRLISAAIVTAPLLMPFYFDYDLLLLAIPAVLLAAEHMKGVTAASDQWLVPMWSAFYLWLMVNPDVAEKTRINLAVPLLAGVSALMIRRINLVPGLQVPVQHSEPLRAAA